MFWKKKLKILCGIVIVSGAIVNTRLVNEEVFWSNLWQIFVLYEELFEAWFKKEIQFLFSAKFVKKQHLTLKIEDSKMSQMKSRTFGWLCVFCLIQPQSKCKPEYQKIKRKKRAKNFGNNSGILRHFSTSWS